MTYSLKHKIGQMFFAGFPSAAVDAQAEALAREYKVGNFILFARNFVSAAQTAALTGGLSRLVYEETGMAPFISADQEGGSVLRIREGALQFSGAMAVAAADSEEDAFLLGKNCGELLRAHGVNINFAPVMDVNSEPLNPVIGNRSFGDDPASVARLSIAMAKGMAAGGVLPVVKHYPGHGNVKSDSHLKLPFNDSPLSYLEQNDFYPFEQAFRAGAEALMSCHVCFDAIDAQRPATLSPAILTELLRKKQGFEGLVVTDCMEMKAIAADYPMGEAAVLAVEAGADILCISHSLSAVKEAAEGILSAVAGGRLSEARIDASFRRIRAAKERYGLLVPQQSDAAAAEAMLYEPQRLALVKRVAQNSITLLSDNGGAAAFRSAKKPLFIVPRPYARTGVEEEERVKSSLAAAAKARFGADAVEYIIDGEMPSIPQGYDMLVLGLYNARFHESQIKLLRAAEESKLPLVVLLLGGPYDAALIKRADACIAAYEFTPLSVEALLAALADGIFPGKAPVVL
ncbi:MAG: glycoside hydrolase family 3 protein [Clostridiales bacterium]|nr:glycoside hydrolase family 3 protein [Clostridiales bacterium]